MRPLLLRNHIQSNYSDSTVLVLFQDQIFEPAPAALTHIPHSRINAAMVRAAVDADPAMVRHVPRRPRTGARRCACPMAPV